MKFAIKKIHFVGIGGTGMNGIAEVLINLGYHVSGSDLKENAAVEHLRSIGAEIFIGHDASNVGDAGVVVTSTAVHADNPEVVEAKNRNIPVVPRAIMLAELSVCVRASLLPEHTAKRRQPLSLQAFSKEAVWTRRL